MHELRSITIYAASERHGDDVTVRLVVELPEGSHIEPHEPSDPFLIPTVLHTEDVLDPSWTYPTPVVKDLGFAGMALSVLEGTLEFVVTGRLVGHVDVVTGSFAFQPCIGGACLPPRTIEWQAPVDGAAGYSVLGALAA